MRRAKHIITLFTIAAMIFTTVPSMMGGINVHAASYKKPAQVKGLKASARTDISVTLKWGKVTTKGLKGYAIYRYDPRTNKLKLLKRVSASTLKYKDKKLRTGTTYKYRVKAFTSYLQYYNTKTKKWVNKQPKAKQWKTKKTRKNYVYGKASKTLSVKTKTIKTGEKSASKITLDALREEEFKQLNKQRAGNGKAGLSRSSDLDRLAQEKAEDMYALRELSHYSKNLGNIKTQLINAGIADMSCGENILQGAGTVTDAMNLWMNSSGHRANILDADYTHVGFGYYKGYWVQQFAQNPVHSYLIECPSCGSKNWEVANYYYITTKDDDGNTVKIWNCSSCGKMNSLCPICEKAAMVASGINQRGSVASKCPNCGHCDAKVCIEKCDCCGSDILNNTEEDEFVVRYNKDTHFQEIGISLDYCKSCKKYVLAGEYEKNCYQEEKAKLLSMLESDEDVFSYITWWKLVPGETVDSGDGWSYTQRVRSPMETPEINSLEELYGQPRL